MFASLLLELKFMLSMVRMAVVIGDVERFSQVRSLPVFVCIVCFLINNLDLALFISLSFLY